MNDNIISTVFKMNHRSSSGVSTVINKDNAVVVSIRYRQEIIHKLHSMVFRLVFFCKFDKSFIIFVSYKFTFGFITKPMKERCTVDSRSQLHYWSRSNAG